jgi:hypothetical protein
MISWSAGKVWGCDSSEDVVFWESVWESPLWVLAIRALVTRFKGAFFLILITGLEAGMGRGLAGSSGESDSPYATALRDRVDLVEVVGTGEMDLGFLSLPLVILVETGLARRLGGALSTVELVWGSWPDHCAGDTTDDDMMSPG